MYKQSRGWQMLQLSKKGATAGLQTNTDAPTTVALEDTADSRSDEKLAAVNQPARLMTDSISGVPEAVKDAILDMIVEVSEIGKKKTMEAS